MKRSAVGIVMAVVFLVAGLAFAGTMMMDKDMMMDSAKMMMKKAESGGMEKKEMMEEKKPMGKKPLEKKGMYLPLYVS